MKATRKLIEFFAFKPLDIATSTVSNSKTLSNLPMCYHISPLLVVYLHPINLQHLVPVVIDDFYRDFAAGRALERATGGGVER